MKKIIRKGDRARRQRVSKPQRFNSNRVSLVRSSAAGEPGELARITGEREEALTQQTATSELLAIISSGVAELEPILRAILEKAKLSISDAFSRRLFPRRAGRKGSPSWKCACIL